MQLPTRRRQGARALLLFGVSLSPAAFAAVSGVVFQDYNSNGVRDPGSLSTAADRGIGGITVRAYDAAGACGTPATTSSVPASIGTYTLDTTGCGSANLRVEFTGYPAGMEPSFHARASSGATTATQAGTTVQFAADGTTNLEVALNFPAQYCQNDPLIAVVQQAFGAYNAPANAAVDSVVRLAYSLTGSTGTPRPAGMDGVAAIPEIGTVYGLAYDRGVDRLYIGAYHKRHAGFGPVGTGAIYAVDAASTGAPSTPATLVDLNAVFGPGTAGNDTVRGNYEGTAGGDQTWDEVGKSSLGDIEVNSGGTRLYAVNLADRQLYTIPTTGALNATTITRQPIPHPCTNAADARPFALGYDNGTLYVGGVCSAQTSGNRNNLSAWIYAYNETAGTFAPVLQFPLNYPRAAGNDDAINDPTGDAIWRAWTNAPGVGGNTGSVFAEPMFSDIVFDRGDMILGFRDRHGDQTGTGNVGTIRGITAGELLRACANGSGGWDLESNGTCGGVTGAAGTATNQARGPASAGNTRGGEFYPLDHYADTTPPFFVTGTDYNGRHDENAQGSMTQVPGYTHVAVASMDPFRFNSGGLRWYSNTDPANTAITRGFEIFQTGAGGFSKANGMGDMDVLCRAAPVEVGNYVWRDSNGNGVMDPGEPPIAGVVLTLYGAGDAVLGSATTNAQGEYYFVFNQGATDPSNTDNTIIGPNVYNGAYVVGIDASNFAGGALAGLRATLPNNGGPTNGGLRDSDGVPTLISGSVTTAAAVALTGPGVNNHTIDFGFGPVDFGDLPDTGAGNGPGNYSTLDADNGPSHGIVTGLFLGATVDGEADGQPNAGATGDDTAGTPDDEDGVTIPTLVVGRNATIIANATNTTGTAATLCGFIDFNGDGDFADAGESASSAVPNGITNGAISVDFGNVPAGAASSTYARFRLSTDTTPCSPVGAATDGEVEDYTVQIDAYDFGDLPDAGQGNGAGNYNTLEFDNGARHTIVPGLFMGAGVDAEADGQPNAGADGDDTNGTPDDEDGVNTADLALIAGTTANIRVTLTNTTGTAARLCGFVDFNGDGDFADAGESQTASIATGSTNLVQTLAFPVPLNAVPASYSRFRLDNGTGPCDPAGPANSGEVEDYPVSVGQLDYGDLPAPYATTNGTNGPRHPIVPGLHIGANEDGEADGQPSAGADGDDTSGTPDDEDGVNTADLAMTVGTTANVRVTVTNTLGQPAQLCGFVDFNGDGDFADAGETTSIAVPSPSNAALVTLNFGTVPVGSAANSYARFRLSTDGGACSPVGPATNGEVEDYPVTVAALDFGDLPDVYGTLLASSGARHTIVPNLHFGATVDAEADGQPTVAATGDDGNGTPDDEDGANDPNEFTLHRGVQPVISFNVTNNTGTAATACGFVDLNGDGDFADAGETAQVAVPTGTNNSTIAFTFGAVPATGANTSYARFRLSTGGTCSPTGAAADGEVEDYAVNVGDGVLSLGNLVWNDANNNGTVDPGENGIPNVPVSLYIDADNNGVPDGPAVASTTTDPNGIYRFTALDPNTYIVEITPPAGWLGSTCSGFPYATTGTCEPAADPDNDTDNNDDGTLAGSVIRSGPITLSPGDEPSGKGTENTTVDFGLLGNFDLALVKRVAAGQTGPFIPGQDVTFDIVVTNQGGIAAQRVVVNDYIPAGFALSPSETNWTSVSPTLATRTIAGPIAPGASETVQIVLQIQAGATSPLVNRAEIGSADDDNDPNNTPPKDIDSTPDNDPSNDAGGSPGTPSDDSTGGNGSGTPGDGNPTGDEDDADPATVTVGNGAAVLGVAKAVELLGITGNGGEYGNGGAPATAQLAYVVTVRNYSTQAVTNLQVVENLVTGFGSGNNWSVGGITAPTLTVNPAFDGRTNTNLLAGSDTLAAGATTTVRLVMTVQFSPGRTYSNQVIGSGTIGTVPVSDSSQNGSDPAPGGDPGSADDPTVITLGSTAIPALSAPMLTLMIGSLVLLAGLRRRRGARLH